VFMHADISTSRQASFPERLWLSCILASLHDLKRSVEHGQPMSLPNLLRRFQRRISQVVDNDSAADAIERGRHLLRSIYLEEQPFTRTSWQSVRTRVTG
jgi:hypothetical protein